MSSWDFKPLEQVCVHITDGSHYSPATVDSGFPYITVRDLKEDRIEFADCKRISADDFASLVRNGCKPMPGDVLFSKDGTVGKVALVGSGADFVVLSSLAIVRPDQKQILPPFLKYVMKAPVFLDEAIGRKTGVAIRRIILRNLKSMHVPVPPRTEQERIVRAMDEAFEAIAVARTNAEKNLESARGLLRAELSTLFARLSNEVPLSHLATDITDGDHAPPPKASEGVPFITISDIRKDTREIDFTDTFMVPQDYFRGLKANRKPRLGDVLYTVTGATLGIPVLVSETRDFCFQRHIGLIRPKPTTDSRWISYALLAPQSYAQASTGSTGAAQKTVSLSVLRSLKLPSISQSDQKKQADRLDELSIEIRRLESTCKRKLAALDELKKSLLHQAFTGKL